MDKVREIVVKDRRSMVQKTVTDVAIRISSVHFIIITAGLRLQGVSAKLVRKLQTEQQKKLRKGISEDMLHFENHDPEYMEIIVAGDKNLGLWLISKTKFQSVSLIPQTPYSPKLASCDFWLSSKIKITLKERRSKSRKDVMKKLTKGLQNNPGEFRKCF